MTAAAWSRLDEPLDTTVRLTTPERIVFEYPLAGPFRRFVAYSLDAMFLVCIFVAATIVALIGFGFVGASGAGAGVILVGYFVLVWGYGAFCEGFFNGQTLGKKLMGIRVIAAEGVPITGAQALLRNLVGTLDGPFAFAYLLGLASMLLTRKFQRLGDLAAGTIVVVEERRRRAGVRRVTEPAVLALLPWLPLRIEAGSEMARAPSDYVRRRERFSRSRREAIAEDLARPLRERYGLPVETPADIVLCAVYHRVFVGD